MNRRRSTAATSSRSRIPSNYAAHEARGGRLGEVARHGGRANQVQLYGEYLLAASGSGGFQVFDVANVGNKDFAQRIVTAPFASQRMRVGTRNATGLAIGSPAPLDLKRVQLPVNEEQPIAPIYGYAFVSDAVEGLSSSTSGRCRTASRRTTSRAVGHVQPGRPADRRDVDHARRRLSPT